MIITTENANQNQQESDTEAQPLLVRIPPSINRIRRLINHLKSEDRKINYSFGFFVIGLTTLVGLFTYLFYYLFRDIHGSEEFKEASQASMNTIWHTKTCNFTIYNGDQGHLTCSKVIGNWKNINEISCQHGLALMQSLQGTYDQWLANFVACCNATYIAYCAVNSSENKEIAGDRVLISLLAFTVAALLAVGVLVKKRVQDDLNMKMTARADDDELREVRRIFTSYELGELENQVGHEVSAILENFVSIQLQNRQIRKAFLEGQFDDNATTPKLPRSKSLSVLAPRKLGLFAKPTILTSKSLPNIFSQDKRTPLQRFFAEDANRDLVLKIFHEADLTLKKNKL